MFPVALLSLLVAPSYSAGDHPRVEIATSPEPDNVLLVLGDPPAALVRDERRVGLPGGEVAVDLVWQGTKLVPESLQLDAVDPDLGLRIRGPVVLADPPQQARWTVTAPRTVEAGLVFTYLLNGVQWTPEHALVLDEAAQKLSLSTIAAIRNDSGEDFEHVRIDLGLSAPVTVDLMNGATLRLPYLEAPTASYELVHVYDAAAAGDTEVRLDLANTREAGLGAAPVPAGKARLHTSRAPEPPLFVGEANLPYIPVGAEAEVVLAKSREVTVQRRVLSSRQVNVKKDVHGRLALYDQEDEVAFAVESQKDAPLLLRIVETIPGEWRMLSNSHEFERRDAEHVEFIVTVEGHGEVTVRYKARRENLTP